MRRIRSAATTTGRSSRRGWNSSPAYYISATNILGPYGTEKVMVNSDRDYCHVTQTGFFVTVKGTEDTTVIFAGDRWAGFAGNGLGFNQWTPVSFDGTGSSHPAGACASRRRRRAARR